MDGFSISVGKILEFDTKTTTATVKVLTSTIVESFDANYTVAPSVILYGVPVSFPRTAGYMITLPVKAGDYCILGVPDQGIDHWFVEGREAYRQPEGRPEPAASRHKNPTDAIVLSILGNSLDLVDSYSENNIEIRSTDNTQVIRVSADGVDIETPGKITMATDTVEVNATAEVTVTAPQMTFDGLTHFTGNMTCDTMLTVPVVASSTIQPSAGPVTVDGVGVKAHTHKTTVSGGSSAGTYTSEAP